MPTVRFGFDKGTTNAHDWRTGHGVMRRGPKLVHVKLSVHKPSTGHRFIWYFRDGSCWYFDIFIDRRKD